MLLRSFLFLLFSVRLSFQFIVFMAALFGVVVSTNNARFIFTWEACNVRERKRQKAGKKLLPKRQNPSYTLRGNPPFPSLDTPC
jgi:hypothetical protein